MKTPESMSPALEAIVAGAITGTELMLANDGTVETTILLLSPTGLCGHGCMLDLTQPSHRSRAAVGLRSVCLSHAAHAVVFVALDWQQPGQILFYIETRTDSWLARSPLPAEPSAAKLSPTFADGSDFEFAPLLRWPSANDLRRAVPTAPVVPTDAG